MSKISFSVSARTAKLIGRENFSNAEGAVIELVKNSYDADAKNCLIVLEDRKGVEPALYIIDDGEGMTASTIKKSWMKIGTDEKFINYQTNEGRVKTGAKGIGRFALDRLGTKSEMHTVSKEARMGEKWSVNWGDFDKPGVSIDRVKADLTNIKDLNLNEYLKNEFKGLNRILELTDKMPVTNGTVLKITGLRDIWNEEASKDIFDNLEVLIPPMEQPKFDIYFFSSSQITEFGKVNSAYYDDFDYKFRATYIKEKNIVNFEVTRKELSIKELENSYKEVFALDQMKDFPYTLKTFKDKSFRFSKDIFEVIGSSKAIDRNLIDQIGDFEFVFYFIKNTLGDDRKDGDLKKYPYLNFSSASRKAWLKKFGGVKIFRDDFRVRPYGENGQDWLGLGERQAKSPGGPGQKLGGYRIGPNQIAGTVKISRINNDSFQDKSGREGIQENEVFSLFKNLLVESIAVFERDRNVIMYSLSRLAKKRYKDEQERAIAKEIADKILEELEEESRRKETITGEKEKESDQNTSQNTENARVLAKATKIYEQELEDRNEEIRSLRGLASVGLIISSFAHELKSLRTRLSPRTMHLSKEMEKYISKESLKSVVKDDNPFYMLELIQNEDVKLKHWLDYSLNTLKADKRKRLNINVGEYFEYFSSIWSNALIQRKVSIELKGTKDDSNVIRAFEVDLDAIFNNLLSNSLTAFKEKKNPYPREITISWKIKGENIEIIFKDNGCGLAPEYINDPNKIFEFNESSKRDRQGNKIGTGMGLYIVQMVIDDYDGASIHLLSDMDGFSVQVDLPMRKN